MIKWSIFADLALLLTITLVQSSLGFSLKSEVINGQYAGTPVKNKATGEIIVQNKGQFPYIVAVESNERHKCGGVVISCNLILTAGHCVDNLDEDDLTISAGSFRRNDAGDRSRQIRKVKLIKIHPLYTRQGPRYDLAVLVLKKGFNFNIFVGPILLPESNENFIGEKVIILGWGLQNGRKAKDLQKAILKVISPLTCQKIVNYQVDSSVICAIDEPEYKRGHTKGDSGGPLLLRSSSNDPKKDVLVGIVSFSTKKENHIPDTHKPFIYANVPEMVSWVKQLIELHNVKKGISCFG